MAGTDNKRQRKWIGFLTGPFAFTKKILEEKRSCYQERTTTKIDSFLHNNLKDPNRERDLTENTLLINPEAPKREFVLKEPTWDEIKAVIKTIRSASASDPSGMPYNAYERCHQHFRFLWKLIKLI